MATPVWKAVLTVSSRRDIGLGGGWSIVSLQGQLMQICACEIGQ